jgi:alpha-methylacyl-CoA racemase
MIDPPRERHPTNALAAGPLKGVRVLEFAGAGPGPMCGMILSDMGADVVRVDRPDAAEGLSPEWPIAVIGRGRASIALDLKAADDCRTCLEAIDRADVLIEGFRPGVMERLGLGPDIALERNPRLVYGRATGWGQEGPLSQLAGHDINYIALTGALAALGAPGEAPPPPLNLVGDMGGGALFLAFGIAAALFERERSGRGQVVDAAIVDGTSVLMATFAGMLATRADAMARGEQGLAGARDTYRCYACADGGFVAVGAIEEKFQAVLFETLGVSPPPPTKEARIAALGAAFRTRTRAEWARAFAAADGCVTPVLDLTEAFAHPQLRGRDVFVDVAGITQPAPAPRFSRTPGRIQGAEPAIGAGGRERLAAWGVAAEPQA